jgi:hypothetical protein
MRGAGTLLKSAWQRRWFVLDKKQQLLSHGPLVAPFPEVVDVNAGKQKQNRFIYRIENNLKMSTLCL